MSGWIGLPVMTAEAVLAVLAESPLNALVYVGDELPVFVFAPNINTGKYAGMLQDGVSGLNSLQRAGKIELRDGIGSGAGSRMTYGLPVSSRPPALTVVEVARRANVSVEEVASAVQAGLLSPIGITPMGKVEIPFEVAQAWIERLLAE